MDPTTRLELRTVLNFNEELVIYYISRYWHRDFYKQLGEYLKSKFGLLEGPAKVIPATRGGAHVT